ncbi:hypothetical protein RHGRI_020828 [Rhododendron griersonianum]|uniref:hAT-like transposase RNase-H fold domain-containing protein n=1 Tax=Rhododendron griersonianum TaxID=479676 RepID=A0AAV6JHQ5_9ERIC|nr:hypothetical protein RHGRI_020828 [Rhododendron griersonianum]
MSSTGEAETATADEIMESDADAMSEPEINISSDEEDEVTASKSKGRPLSVVWKHFDRVTRKGQTKPDRAKFMVIDKFLSDYLKDVHGMYVGDVRVGSRAVLVDMAKKMKKKFDKYWGKVESMNMMMFIAIVLDPRFKLRYVKFCFSELFDSDVVEELTKMIRGELDRAFVEYEKFNLNWLRATPLPFEVEENIEEMQELELALQNVSLNPIQD